MNDPDDGGKGKPVTDLLRFLVGLSNRVLLLHLDTNISGMRLTRKVSFRKLAAGDVISTFVESHGIHLHYG